MSNSAAPGASGAVEVGQAAPAFSLVHQPGQDPIQLSDYAGEQNVVLLFFPLAWSSVCTEELCSIRENYSRYGALDAEILGISVDSPFALQAWSKEESFPFPLLSDFNKEVSGRYGALYDEFFGMQGVSKRAAFVVDKQGIVRYAEVLENAGEQPNFKAIAEILADSEGS
ncbi:MAG: redoxin domain-containing protein [Acidobacteriota bacterium]